MNVYTYFRELIGVSKVTLQQLSNMHLYWTIHITSTSNYHQHTSQTCVCVGKSTPPACQTTTNAPHRLAFVSENPHHKHVKPLPTQLSNMHLCCSMSNTNATHFSSALLCQQSWYCDVAVRHHCPSNSFSIHLLRKWTSNVGGNIAIHHNYISLLAMLYCVGKVTKSKFVSSVFRPSARRPSMPPIIWILFGFLSHFSCYLLVERVSHRIRSMIRRFQDIVHL